MRTSSEIKNCQNCKNDFTIEPDDFEFYEKIKVPPPTFCPECRSQRRLTWRNDITFCNRNCGLCNKSVVTIYSKESGINVYCNKCWWSDKWDAMDYGQDYDFSRPFFEQFQELVLKVPQMALVNDDGIASVNCEYTQDFAFSKNVYMGFIGWKVENVMYSYYLTGGKDLMDCVFIRSKNEWLYECMIARDNFRLNHCEHSLACMESYFLDHCTNCSDCFMCFGLVGKKNCFQNKQYSKEDYEKILESYRLDTFSGLEKAKKDFEKFMHGHFRRFAENYHTVSSTGDLLSHSKNVQDCFNVKNGENCKWVCNADTPKDSYDLTIGGELSECYEGITCDHSNRNFFGIFSWKDQDVEYTQHCHSSQYLFACVGLKSKKYCIFNKQYTKEEYEILVEKIKKHMDEMPYVDKKGNVYKYGEFYPAELSYFGYNESVAPEHFPLTKAEALDQGCRWQDNIQRTTGKETLKPENIPESIKEVEDSILNEVLMCIDCKRNYKIVPNELIFYKKMNIPVARRCFYCRHENRLNKRNPFKLWHRKCMKEGCDNTFETSYAPDRPEIIYCEKCYQQEVY